MKPLQISAHEHDYKLRRHLKTVTKRLSRRLARRLLDEAPVRIPMRDYSR